MLAYAFAQKTRPKTQPMIAPQAMPEQKIFKVVLGTSVRICALAACMLHVYHALFLKFLSLLFSFITVPRAFIYAFLL